MHIRLPLALLGLFLLPLLCGCEDNHISIQAQLDYHYGDFEQAEAQLRPLAAKPDENYVLNNLRLGSVAMPPYDLVTAESAFTNASGIINSTGTNDAGRALSAALIGENTKVWKGEPFERAMCNYYLGLLYYIRQDYNNSRASFENALFKLRDYGDPDHPQQYTEFDSNFVLAYLMLGKCYLHLNEPDRAKAMFDTATRIRPDLAAVAQGLSQPSNVVLIVDWGWGPRKITTVDHAFAGYYPAPFQAG
jgi:tetratricopeptide (TPR) repeat protein